MQTNNFLAQLDKTEMSQLTQEVKETVVTNSDNTNHKNMLSTADFWNIQKMVRPRIQRRYIL